MFEALVTAVIRIRYFGLAMSGAIVTEELDFVMQFTRGIEGARIDQVVVVHRQNQIVGFKIAGLKLTRMADDRDIACTHAVLHAFVRR